MKVKMELEIQPFSAPMYVLVEQPTDSDRDALQVPLSDVSACDLEALCNDFRDAVFATAKKQRPAQAAPFCARCDSR